MIVLSTHFNQFAELVAKLKERLPNLIVVGVDVSPEADVTVKPNRFNSSNNSSDLSSIIDKSYNMDLKDSGNMTRTVIKSEGLLCGYYSGSLVAAATQAAKELTEDQICLVVLPDPVSNFMSKFLNDNWFSTENTNTIKWL